MKIQAANRICMKKILAILAVAGSVSLCQAQTVTLNSFNEPGNENVDTAVYGSTASAQFSLTGSTLTISSGSFLNLWGAPIAVAVWDGAAGTVGTELFALDITGASNPSGNLYNGTFNGAGSLTSGQITDYGADDLYLNITTVGQGAFSGGNANGEVRGQLVAVPEPATMSLIAVGSAAWFAKRRKKA